MCGDTVDECERNIHETVTLFEKLGFITHKIKSILKPTNQRAFLGNIIDPERMIVTLPREKQETIKTECEILYSKYVAKIREVARVTGLIVSSFSAVEYGKLYYRKLENQKKMQALKNSKGKFDANMLVTSDMKEDLEWWIINVFDQFRIMSHGTPEITIETDASLLGWGAVIGQNKIGGRWTGLEQQNHINYLEMIAIWFALKSFKDEVPNRHVKILSDNTTAVSYINNMGGYKSVDCNEMAKTIWSWCIENNIWISCTHIPGRSNVQADKKSRNFNDQLEWKLNEYVFRNIVSHWGKPNIDLFASRLNFQVENYCSWKPDPYAQHVNALLLNWGYCNLVYFFPPFSLLSSCIRKLRIDSAQGIVVAPSDQPKHGLQNSWSC